MEIKFFKKKKKFKKGGSGIKPDLYWKYILSTAFILILISFALGLYLFMKISNKPILSSTDANQQDAGIKKERIDKVLEYFSEREKKSARILNSPSPIIDPSL